MKLFVYGFRVYIVVISVLVLHVINAYARSDAHAEDIFDINDDVSKVNRADKENSTPIIGVLTQETTRFIKRKFPDQNYTSYIAASYVKFVEGAGGRVTPIWIDRERNYYEDVLTKINGVLFPGGATYFESPHGYAAAGKHIFDIAIEMNDRGVYMPIWGTCLGFELLGYLSAGQVDVRTNCSSSNQASMLEFKGDAFERSRMFGNAPKAVIEILRSQPVTSNSHIYCFTEKNFTTFKLDQQWDILSVSYDWNGLRYISAMEHKRYPFYGVQFHPEKNLYEFVPHHNISHTTNAILASQYFANFAVNEARRNPNRFPNKTDEMKQLIYNYRPMYSGIKGSAFMQVYLFAPGAGAASAGNAQQQQQPSSVRLLSVLVAIVWLCIEI